MTMEYGKNSDMSDDNILSISSPMYTVGGPYKVVYKNVDARWAIVALNWSGKATLGIRWFTDTIGLPNSRGYPTWFVIPSELQSAILNGIPMELGFKMRIIEYLQGKITGEDLKSAD